MIILLLNLMKLNILLQLVLISNTLKEHLHLYREKLSQLFKFQLFQKMLIKREMKVSLFNFQMFTQLELNWAKNHLWLLILSLMLNLRKNKISWHNFCRKLKMKKKWAGVNNLLKHACFILKRMKMEISRTLEQWKVSCILVALDGKFSFH